MARSVSIILMATLCMAMVVLSVSNLVPTFLWSERSYLPLKYQLIRDSCNVRDIVNSLTSNTQSVVRLTEEINRNKIQYLAVFVLNNIDAKTFRSLSGAFAATKNGAKLANLKLLLETNPSSILPACNAHNELAQDLASNENLNVITVQSVDVAGVQTAINSASSAKLNVLIFNVDSENIATMDAQLPSMMRTLSSSSNGQYMSLLTSVMTRQSSDNSAVMMAARFNSLMQASVVLDTNVSNVTNSTIYITSEILNGLLVGLFLLLLVASGFWMLTDIKTANHIIDSHPNRSLQQGQLAK